MNKRLVLIGLAVAAAPFVLFALYEIGVVVVGVGRLNGWF